MFHRHTIKTFHYMLWFQMIIMYYSSLVFVVYFKQAYQPAMKHFVGKNDVNLVAPCAAVA